jgi:type IV secretion system protein VirB8
MTDLADNYRAVTLMSGREEDRLFRASIAANNPASPVVVFGPTMRRTIHIKSIAFLHDGMAQIRFTATDQRSASAPKSSDWIATVAYKFAAAPSLEADRLINPLGFSVLHYRIDQEVIP